MKKITLIFVMALSILIVFSSCENKNDVNKSANINSENVTEIKMVEVTDESGEKVTNKSGEVVTEVAAVKLAEKEIEVPVTNRNGESVTKANGEVITETKKVTEYVNVTEHQKENISNTTTNKTSTTTKVNITKSSETTKETTKATTKPVTTTTTKPQETTTIVNKKTAADLTYRDATTIEQELLEKINASRTEAGVQPVVWDKTLTALADIRCKEFMSNHLLAHTRPDGTNWSSIFDEYSITCYGNRGENLLSQTGLSSTRIHNSFMNSSSHKDNILTYSWNCVGISIIYDSDTNFVFVCEIFSTTR